MKVILLHWIQAYGYLGVFASLMLGMFGLPVPDESIMTFTGFLIYKSQFQPLPAFLAAFGGSICGITLNYGVGRLIGLRLVIRYGRYLHVTAEKLERAHGWFEKYGKWALFGGYFLPGVRHLAALTAGTTRLEYGTFALFAYSGAALWVSSFITLGYFLGEEWHLVTTEVQKYLWVAVGMAAGLVLLYLLWRQIRRPTPADPANREK